MQALAAAAAALDALAAAVRDANTGYAQQESDHADQINRSGLV